MIKTQDFVRLSLQPKYLHAEKKTDQNETKKSSIRVTDNRQKRIESELEVSEYVCKKYLDTRFKKSHHDNHHF